MYESMSMPYRPPAYEVAVKDRRGILRYDTPITSDVELCEDEDEVGEVLAQIAALTDERKKQYGRVCPQCGTFLHPTGVCPNKDNCEWKEQ
jgi:hypothetical protein